MTTALYRRYRPQTFAEVIGQDHVTAPLRAALRSGQVNHAYLFSGPRGCGKTSSARILARCLNCAQGPTDTPCGECDSCRELGTGGPGSLDVVEIDAASHGGVDDARELRERATYAPARDRYKVFILDEAHMVSNQGFNALLKIVEEPPPHVKFVFATTEPDKVIPTIRSRTHHYPFRLVPPDVLVPFLQHVCEQEGVPVGSGVLPLVVRAGAGSVRDSLSVLDQLIAGAGAGGLEYDGAVALLGYTPAALLDDLVDAIAARDGATVFAVVERVVATGHDPRRFVEDLLERLRDLIVIAAAGPAASAALRAVPADGLERMRAQAGHLGRGELSRSADLANAALTEMAGATSPRLLLELLMARLLLPAADDGATGFAARLDRLERGWTTSLAAVAPAAAPVVAAPASGVPAAPVGDTTVAASADSGDAPSATSHVPAAPIPSAAPAAPGAAAAPNAAPTPAATAAPTASAEPTRPAAPAAPMPAAASVARTPAPASVAPASAPAPVAPSPAVKPVAGQDTEMLRRRWPEVLETVKGLRRATWILVGQNAQVHDLDASMLRLSFPTSGLVDRFRDHADVVARAVHETLGFTVHVQAVVGGADAGSSGGASSADTPAAGNPAARAPATSSSSSSSSSASSASSAAAPPHGIPSAAQAEASWDPPARSSSAAARPGGARAVARPTAEGPDDDDLPDVPDLPDDDLDDPGDTVPAEPGRGASQEDAPSPDDPLIEGSNLVGAPLVARLLGGTVIDEQVDGPGR